MKFDKSRVFTAVNADEVEVGRKGYFADCLSRLKQIVEEGELGYFGTVDFICTDDDNHCFQSVDIGHYRYFYLIEEPVSEIKEVAASEWDNRPRLMKVWKDSYYDAEICKVLAVRPSVAWICPVVALDNTDSVRTYKHCAEIEAEKIEAEKHYRPYRNVDEFISDYKKRFCPDCRGIPAIWVKSKSKADALKQVIRIDNDIVIDNIITNGVWIATDRFFDFEDFFNTYTYPDGSPCGMEMEE